MRAASFLRKLCFEYLFAFGNRAVDNHCAIAIQNPNRRMHVSERIIYLAYAVGESNFIVASVLRDVHIVAHLRYNFRAVLRNVFGNRIALEWRVDRHGKIIAANFFRRENFVSGNASVLGIIAERGRSKIFRAYCRGAQRKNKSVART